MLLGLVIIVLFIHGHTSFASHPVIKYTVDRNYPPYTFDIEGGFYGFDPALTNLIFKREDYEAVYSTNDWANVYASVKGGDIISIAHKLDLIIIAEGVENSSQLEYLKMAECDAIQGYLFSKPLNKDSMVELFQKLN